MNNDKYKFMLNLFDNASTAIQILPVDTSSVEELDGYIKYNTDSDLGIVLTKTGGIIIDNWIRIYGCGEIDFVTRNKKLQEYGAMIIAEDIAGGLFSMTLDGELSYFAPDCLEWEKMSINYSDFLQWITEQERLDLFYETFRFDNWQNAIKDIKTDQGIGFFPFLWTESEKERHTEIIPIMEIQNLQLEFVNFHK